MKLSIALLALLPAVLAAPVAVDIIENGIETSEETLEEPPAPFSLSFDGVPIINPGAPLDGAKTPDLLNARDGDLISVGDTTALIKPELEVLSERDGDDSAAIEVPGKNLVDDINKSIGTQLKTTEPRGLINTKINDDPGSRLGKITITKPDLILSDKRELSSAEILANARKALSAAERDHERYPNEIAKAAYTNAVATVQALQKSSN